ncbi:pseudouridine synthase [Clostridium polynesiense]|uniref:pseudouridine synthase n=1 Tax=Clostridium polynesiense TaxID=1325933 RepID=UPI00058C263F|nr:pseudouridine synthase [Clostridium polynesiense]
MIMRLQKYLAQCGVASRRKSEELILQGRVYVNDMLIKDLGVKIDSDNDEVKVNNTIVKPEENKVYIMLNKPEGYITTLKDEKNRKKVVDLIRIKERIFPVGRLDYNTSGLLILTNDGEIYNNIMHPSREIEKTYMARVKGIFTRKELQKFERGVDIGGYITAPAKIKVIKLFDNDSLVEIKIHEGKNRQIRRMCEKLNHKVLELQRISLGEIELGDLPKGSWRHLNKKELEYIFSL